MQDVARHAGVSRPAVWRWQQRSGEEGIDGLLHDKTRPPGIPPHPTRTVAEVLALTCSEPPDAVTPWTGRAVATRTGISLRSVQRIWQAHRRPTASGPHLQALARPGLALERTRPDRPVGPSHPATRTHDHTRCGTTTLFAALNVREGTVLGRCLQRHRHGAFIRCLNAVEAAVPAGKLVHVILDNEAVHKHATVRAWLARHPRWTFHVTPTSASWLNAVEGFFSALTRRRLRRGTVTGLVDLKAAIKRDIAKHNQRPRPVVWTKTPPPSSTPSTKPLNQPSEPVQ